MNLCKIWVEQCEAARGIEAEFGTDKALCYLVGEKFLNFLEAAETDAEFRAEIPDFVAAIHTIFERWQLVECLENARRREPFNRAAFDDNEVPEMIEFERKLDLSRSADDLLLVEQARELLLDDGIA